VVTDREDTEQRLDRLRRATEGAGPRADFTARVMRRISAEKIEGWWSDLPRAARRLVPVAVLAAAVATVMAIRSTAAFDDALSSTDDNGVEIEW
jgi:hypothetical protein